MDLKPGEFYVVTIKCFIKQGAVVILEDGTTELLHVSNISDKFVRAAENFLVLGNTYMAKAIEGTVKPVELSLKYLGLKPIVKSVQLKESEVVQPSPLAAQIETSNPKSNKSLDEMIDKMNRDYKEIHGSYAGPKPLTRYPRKGGHR